MHATAVHGRGADHRESRCPRGRYGCRGVLQERRAARHGGAADRSGQMPQQAPSDARIIDDGQFRGLRPSGIESRDGPLAGAAADDRRIIQVGQVDGGMVVVVALHCRAGSCQRTGRNRVAGSDMTAGKSRGRDQVCLGSAESCLSAFGVGDSQTPRAPPPRRRKRDGRAPRCRARSDPRGRAERTQVARRCRRARHKDPRAPRAPSRRHVRRVR